MYFLLDFSIKMCITIGVIKLNVLDDLFKNYVIVIHKTIKKSRTILIY